MSDERDNDRGDSPYEPMVTTTLAELYEKQGAWRKAVEAWSALEARDGAAGRYRERIDRAREMRRRQVERTIDTLREWRARLGR